jgi:hypothetical protein
VVAIQGMLEKLRPNLAEDTFWQDQNWILISRVRRKRRDAGAESLY